MLEVINLTQKLPTSQANLIFQRQLIRCASSVGANYRAACRAKSRADFIHKMKICEEEIDESEYFLDLLCEINKPFQEEIAPLREEAEQLLAIFVKSIGTAKRNLNRPKNQQP